ncbi:MAG: phenylacetate-CoA oxygenase subunit PaaJ [Bdellovibrionales bacterium]|nr:phenylacetate-CoA oxygenase subunit PaaJ [Bdellovibrionales bacterium]
MTEEEVWRLLEEVKDPEIPVVSIVGMGIVRQVEVEGSSVRVTITPTYSGCPAMEVMEEGVRERLAQTPFDSVVVDLVHYPAWTTDWMTAETKEKLREYGIAPPERSAADALVQIGQTPPVQCPFCGSRNTECKSRFGSTSCKALHFCQSCRQPFEEFKVL